jgi:cephalosporin hydroxylase
VHGRTFETDLPPHLLQTIQLGIYKMRYRGVPLYKNPFDLALFTRLWSKLKPRTVIEVGAKDGGSALWFADLMRAHRVEGTIISIDLVLPERVSDPMIDFRQGDARTLQDVLSAQELAELPHPLLVVEDSAHFYETSRAVLDFFHPHLRRGDYVVVEDGSVSFFGTPEFQVYDDGPNRAVTDFLEAHVDEYEIDVTLCDLFGRNVTANPNGWIKRTRPVRSR